MPVHAPVSSAAHWACRCRRRAVPKNGRLRAPVQSKVETKYPGGGSAAQPARCRACTSWCPTWRPQAELAGRGVPVSEPFHFGEQGQAPGLHPERADYGSFASFQDPDGNGRLVEEVRSR